MGVLHTMQDIEIKKILDDLIPHLTQEEKDKMFRFILAVRNQDVVNFLQNEKE